MGMKTEDVNRKRYDHDAKTKYNENDVKAFVYNWFAKFDHQSGIGFFIGHLYPENVDMYFPDFGPIKSISDFEKWYKQVIDNIQWNFHEISNLTVSGIEEMGFSVSLDISWKAKTYEGKTLYKDVHQDWKVTVDECRNFIIEKHVARQTTKPGALMTTINSLSDAVERNDLIMAERLLKDGHDVNRKNAAGFTPLMIASGLGNPQMVELLLTAGADTTMVDTRMGATALHKAAQSGVVDVAKLLVQKGAFVDVQSPTLGNTPLIDAAWHKNPAMVRYLLDQGARLEIHNRSGMTARNFVEADRALAEQILKLLDERQARDADMIKSQRLMTAVLETELAEVQKLIVARTPLDEKSPLTNENKHAGYTPLLFACLKEGFGDVVKALLEAGTNPRIVDDMIKATPGHKAGYQGRTDAARELVKTGASKSMRKVLTTVTLPCMMLSGTAIRRPSRYF